MGKKAKQAQQQSSKYHRRISSNSGSLVLKAHKPKINVFQNKLFMNKISIIFEFLSVDTSLFSLFSIFLSLGYIFLALFTFTFRFLFIQELFSAYTHML